MKNKMKNKKKEERKKIGKEKYEKVRFEKEKIENEKIEMERLEKEKKEMKENNEKILGKRREEIMRREEEENKKREGNLQIYYGYLGLSPLGVLQPNDFSFSLCPGQIVINTLPHSCSPLLSSSSEIIEKIVNEINNNL
jgi:hypothetical protein